jgi:hypothetical protein
MTDIAGLCERLRAVESSRKFGVTTAVTTNWHRNPDGPEAADAIERLSSENATLTDEIDKIADQAFAADDRATKAAAEIERLRGLLDRIADLTAVTFGSDGHPEVNEIVRAALTGEDAGGKG